MPRSATNTVDYFPHFAEQGKTLFILKARFGNDGYAFWFQLLELLCKEENHAYDFTADPAWQYLLARTGVNEITGTEILKVLADLGKIDPEMLRRKVIWCENLIKNIANVYKKRGRLVPTKPETVTQRAISGAETPSSDTEIPQSRVEYSKVNNIIYPENSPEYQLALRLKTRILENNPGQGSLPTFKSGAMSLTSY